MQSNHSHERQDMIPGLTQMGPPKPSLWNSDHLNNAFIKAKQKAYVVNRFARYGATVTLTKQLFNSLYASDNVKLNKPYQILKKLDNDHKDFMSILSESTLKYAMNILHDESHFIHGFIHKLPFGRYQTYKHRSPAGSICFLRHYVLLVNNILSYASHIHFLLLAYFIYLGPCILVSHTHTFNLACLVRVTIK